jgi:hypothetical protein
MMKEIVYLFYAGCITAIVKALTIDPPSGIRPPGSQTPFGSVAAESSLGRESDAIHFANTGDEWVQTRGPAGGYIWTQQYAYTDPILPTDLAEPRFQVFYPIEGSYIVPDTITYVTWNTILPTLPAIAFSNPTDVSIDLYNINPYNPEKVQTVAHSVPNIGVFLWVARVPRAWSNDDFYYLRICSLQDTHICSDSPFFRIVNPYAFYP